MTGSTHGEMVEKGLPASGPRLVPALDQAACHLENSPVRNHDRSSQYVKLWQEILRQSKERSDGGVAPNLLKGNVASSTGITLTGRDWTGFENWYARHIAPELQSLSMSTGIPALKAVRIADPNGGYPEESEAVIYLSFVKSIDIKRGQDRSLDSLGSPVNQGETAHYNDGVNASGASLDYRDQLPKYHTATGTHQWCFGVSLVFLSIFLLVFCEYLPESRRLMFVVFSIVLFTLGLRAMDSGNNKGVSRNFFANYWRV